MLTKNKGLNGFIIRFAIFIVLFIALSILLPNYKTAIGQAIYNVNEGYSSFIVYFILAIFIYAKREKIKNSYSYKNKIPQTILFAILAIITFSIPFQILSIGFHIHEIVASYLLSGLGFLFVFLAVFNTGYTFRYLQEEMLTAMLIIIAYAAIPISIREVWTYFFEPSKYGVNFILGFFNEEYMISNAEQGFKVTLGSFRAIVGPACSGIHSIIAFSFLFASSLLLLKKENTINKLKAALFYTIGILSLYILNVIRIIILLYVGAFISEKLAIDLFHEYLSAIFLMSLFLVYLYIFIPKVFVKNN